MTRDSRFDVDAWLSPLADTFPLLCLCVVLAGVAFVGYCCLRAAALADRRLEGLNAALLPPADESLTPWSAP